MNAAEKYDALCSALQGLGRVAVAFSAGVDSALLLHAAHSALGENAVAITVHSPFVPQREQREAEVFCQGRGIRQLVLEIDPLSIENVRTNPPERCYFCKKALFTAMREAAENAGFPVLAEGSNADDLGDYRPGMRALKELNIRSPLLDAGLTKQEIRALAKSQGLPCWDKPAMACLATRIPCGTPLTVEALRRVEQAEEILTELGFRQLRVRAHGNLARLELGEDEFARLHAAALSAQIVERLKSLGFRYVTLDLAGYQRGSMNAAQQAEEEQA